MKTIIDSMDDDDLDEDLDPNHEDAIEIEDGDDTRVNLEDDGDPDEFDGDGADEAEDDDLSSYSKPIQDRIRREREEAAEARERADAAEMELSKTRARAELATIDSELDAAVDEVEEARRDADTRREVLAQAKVNRLAERKEMLAKQQPDGGNVQQQNAALDRWLGRNAWFKDSKQYEAQRSAAIAIGRRVAAEKGLKDDSDEFYAEVDKQLRKTVRLPAREQPSRTTVSRRIGDRGSQDPGARQVRLTADDVRFMHKLKLDPKNKTEVRAYLTEKRNGR